MKNGRNDLCHCGSGKKYKKCCLASDQTAEQSKPAELLPRTINNRKVVEGDSITEAAHGSGAIKLPAVRIPDPKPPDPKMEAIKARWMEFDKATEDVRRELYFKSLDDPELMDDENAFEMLNQLHKSTIKSDERDLWDNMVEQLRQRLPDVYAVSRKYYLGWQITNVIATGRRERLKPLVLEMAELAGSDLDVFSQVVDQLAYHGMLDELSEASHAAWPHIKDSDKIMWGQGTFAEWGSDCVLFQQLEQTGDLSHEDSALMQKIDYYFDDLDVERFSAYIKSICGRPGQTYSLDDFKTIPRQGRNDRYDVDDDRQGLTSESKSMLSMLTDNFLDYARRIEGIPYTKAKLAGANIYSYICGRLAGKLEPRQSVFDSIANPEKKKKRQLKPPEHILCPDRATFDRYLGEQLHFLNPLTYQAAATWELMPAWLRFLEATGLLESELHEKTLNELAALQTTMSKLFEADRSDPALLVNLKCWVGPQQSTVAKHG